MRAASAAAGSRNAAAEAGPKMGEEAIWESVPPLEEAEEEEPWEEFPSHRRGDGVISSPRSGLAKRRCISHQRRSP